MPTSINYSLTWLDASRCALTSSLRKMITSLGVATLFKFVTEKIVLGLPLSYSWENALDEQGNLTQNDNPRIIGIQYDWYPL